MTQDRFVAGELIAVMILDLFTAFVIAPIDNYFAQGLFEFCGLGFFIFGTWAAVRLLQTPPATRRK